MSMSLHDPASNEARRLRDVLADIPEVQKIFALREGSLCSVVVLVLRNDRLIRKLVSDQCDEVGRMFPGTDFDFKIILDPQTGQVEQPAQGWSLIFSRE